MQVDYATILRVGFPTIKFSGTGKTYDTLIAKAGSVIPTKAVLDSAAASVAAELSIRREVKRLKKALANLDKSGYTVVTGAGTHRYKATTATLCALLSLHVKGFPTGIETFSGYVELTSADADTVLTTINTQRSPLLKQLAALRG